MKKNVFLLCVLAVMALTVTNCETEKPPAAPEGKKLEGTGWTLVGFFDVEKNELEEVNREPKDDGMYWAEQCKANWLWCYSLDFRENLSITGYPEYRGKGIKRAFWGTYNIDYTRSIIMWQDEDGTAVVDFDEAERYIEELHRTQIFELNDRVLKLYFSDRKNYLLFKQVVPE